MTILILIVLLGFLVDFWKARQQRNEIIKQNKEMIALLKELTTKK
ncbi:hypothetical protein CAY60_000550 [Shouchella clausii]|jgi:hypothetical protein|uniref:Uncharacterized protein n=1 Tax=Shouchella rhizosphaerae TaxID=866786 RepID=A0ABZ2CW85_9BACI|nr:MULTISPECIES: hypothetical protein [Shouchella]SPT78507.1 Uncharacterised protein [Niallia circulans]ALA53539.1 hypothetical protein DB29_02711 [Shouchella clausii]MCY1104131.1 hypothetical protein [Shouchella clausii]MDO7266531.1 hypothetical protein [Shouchella clausii]MDO7283748.1 hypothetical protein [Shouchella clausii]